MATLSSSTLVLGGVRSGKSRYAESLIAANPGPCCYIATAEAKDAEMSERIARHRARRGEHWKTIEEPLDLAGALERSSQSDGGILVDCLTLWLSNLMGAGRDIEAETRRLADILPHLDGTVVLVSNEVGLGVIPDNPAARSFIDHAGRLHQAVAEVVQQVVFVTAGQPLFVKGQP